MVRETLRRSGMLGIPTAKKASCTTIDIHRCSAAAVVPQRETPKSLALPFFKLVIELETERNNCDWKTVLPPTTLPCTEQMEYVFLDIEAFVLRHGVSRATDVRRGTMEGVSPAQDASGDAAAAAERAVSRRCNPPMSTQSPMSHLNYHRCTPQVSNAVKLIHGLLRLPVRVYVVLTLWQYIILKK